ncbi:MULTISPECIES: isochorismatase family protein [unclassified Archaeoglobus]|jgi:nicotinamidase-related amidase|uniref:isochorismatase family protein n=1 Tax=unclassified Archaeoglobus TaxID=2643606 RepID=UPI0025C10D35|nr:MULTISPECIES: isochorismatase family protein [unclassified Archaeoglobus]
MALVVVDFQEKLAPHIEGIDDILKSVVKLIKALKVLKIPVLVTEQIKLGKTVDVVADVVESKAIEKTTFSCFKNREFRGRLEGLNTDRVILAGIEAHICVLQTAIELKKAGYEVYVAADCIGSRRSYDKDIAIMRMQSEGIRLTTSESIIYEITESAEHPAFKEILEIVKG